MLQLLSIPAWAIGKDQPKVKPASEYPSKQSGSGLTIAAVPYSSADEMKAFFGKIKLYEFGVLPVLLVMKNDSGKTLKLTDMEVSYLTSDRREVAAIPASEVRFLDTPRKPNLGPSPNPLPPRKWKSKLSGPEIESNAFAAKMLPSGDSAHGFFYFQISHRPNALIYVRGIAEAQTGKELLFFEIPL
jgi:hypothetical protein